MSQAAEDTPSSPAKWIVVLVVFAAAVGGYLRFGDSLSLDAIAAQEASLRDFHAVNPVLVHGAAFAAYVAVTGLSLPGAAVLTLVFGWYFGFLSALIMVSFASTTGASLSFLFSRYVLRAPIQERFGERLRVFNDALARDGAFYLFTLRLVPAVPFFVINLVMGLTPLTLSTYWWGSQLGMFPGTAVYVYAGATVPDLATLSANGVGGIVSPQLLLACFLLGAFPLLVKFALRRFRPRSAGVSDRA